MIQSKTIQSKWVFFSGIFLCLYAVMGHGQPKPFESKKAQTNDYPSELFKTQFDTVGSFDVLHYRLDLTFPYTSSAFSGSVTLTCQAKESLSSIDLQMGDLTADHVYLRGKPVSFSHEDELLTLAFSQSISAKDTFSVVIQYHGEPDEKGFYVYDRCAYTFSEPEDARYWYPCHDVPWDKATAELIVTVPAGVEVASVGLLKKHSISPDGLWETFHWATQYPIATYLICITMSDEYATWSDWYITSEGDSIEMPYYVFAEDSAKAKIDVQNMKSAMAFFIDTFGPYPFEKYGTATVEKAWFGGMEHQTMTTVVQNWFKGDGSVESGFVHELSHMWWGDAVTLNNWPAIWLNEGFATYSDILFQDHFYPDQERLKNGMRSYRENYLKRADILDFSIYNPLRENLFNWEVTYLKGAWVLHMLRKVVGDEAFFTILSRYYQKYKYKNASIPEFQAICETQYGQSLDWFFNRWIFQSGYMKLEYQWKNTFIENDEYQIHLFISQQHPEFKMPLDVRLNFSDHTIDSTLWLSRSFETFEFYSPDSVLSMTLDPDVWLLMKDTLRNDLKTIPDFLPETFQLTIAPNPFQTETLIQYVLPPLQDEWQVRVNIYNARGELVCQLIDTRQASRIYALKWDGRDDASHALPSGVYVVEFAAENHLHYRKIMILR